jgi:hypothetical protein
MTFTGMRQIFYIPGPPRDVLNLPTTTMSLDLVALMRLAVRYSPGGKSYVQSTSTTALPAKRPTTQDVQWKRECKYLGGGTFGQVYLEKCMEAGRTEEKRAVKKIRKIGFVDYKRELEVLAALSYRRRVNLPFNGDSTTPTDIFHSTEISSWTSLAGMRQTTMFTLPWNSTNSAHLINTWLRCTLPCRRQR